MSVRGKCRAGEAQEVDFQEEQIEYGMGEYVSSNGMSSSGRNCCCCCCGRIHEQEYGSSDSMSSSTNN